MNVLIMALDFEACCKHSNRYGKHSNWNFVLSLP